MAKKAKKKRRAKPRRRTLRKLKVAIRGEIFAPTGIAKANRELALRLTDAGCRVSLTPLDKPPEGLGGDPRRARLCAMVEAKPRAADVVIRHPWAQGLPRPAGAKVVVMQAWEYGWLPKGWPELIEAEADEVWCYSEYVRGVYARSGVPEEMLKVVPLGVDAREFCPEGPALDIGYGESFKFLWMGLASPRKGVDVLLEAYTREFGPFEDVVLVLKDLILDPTYSADFRARLDKKIASGKLAPILHLTDQLPDSDLPSLYRACDAFVLPFRSEGFCLPIPEAMASELPVICTAYGPPADYCDDSNSYPVACREVEIGSDWDIGVETIKPAFWAEPDVDDLRRAMRRVYDNRDEAQAKAKAARLMVAECLGWDRTAEAARARIEALAGRSRQSSVVSYQSRGAGEEAVGDGDFSRQSRPPKATVVIPVFNGLTYTKEAIRSLQAEAGCGFELIVVDNASTDGTSQWLAEQSDLRVIANRSNQGFARACNQGAQDASTEYVVFLNNDTISLDTWLAKMVAFADDHSDAAIIGAKLLYPGTDRIQHAWLDFDASGIPDHVFRGLEADDPRVADAREVPMVTGACMLVRKSVFRELGGFDEAYTNGVEDIDLCFAARKRGYEVYFCPDAVLYHHEGKTEGRFANVRQNLEQFFSKWGAPEVAQMAAKGKRRKARDTSAESSVASSQLSGLSRQSAVGSRRADIAPIILEGGLFSHHSLAHVNREVLLELTKRGVRAGVIPFEDRRFEPESEPRYAQLAPLVGKIPPDAGIFIRHRWPADLGRPAGYKFVLIQPWEFGYLPKNWVQAIQSGVDEVWAYSKYLRDAYVRSGVAAEKVHLVPLGVAPDVFCPEGDGIEIETEKTCKFLFVGAAVARKGVDLLLEAYCEEFSPTDDVVLIIKDSTYSQIDSEQFQAHVADMISAGDNPEIIYFHGDMGPSEMPKLYRSVDAVVLPYRGEGFCLPAIEAMACGKAVILTGFGPSLDYATPERAYMLPYTVEKFKENSVLGYETQDAPFWAQPDKAALKAAMRSVFSNRDEATKRGEAASRFIRSNFTWERTADAMCDRLVALSEGIGAERAKVQVSAAAPQPAPRPATISLCMIVRDEEEYLPRCLDSVKGMVDEMIIVDTGSEDRTVEIAQRYGAQVSHYEWNDDFAAARSESFGQASCDWILWLDADEELKRDGWPKIKAAIAKDEENAYFLKIKNLHDSEGTMYFTHYLPRLFRRSDDLKIEGTIHEQVRLDNLTKDGHVGTLDVEITHYGYITDLVHAKEKVDRNIRILKAAIEKEPENAFPHYSLAGMYRDIRMYNEAIEEFEVAESLLKGTETYRPMLYNRWASAYEGIGDYERGAECAKKAIGLAPNHPESHYILAQCYRHMGQPASAINEYKAALDCPHSFTLGTIDETTRGYKSLSGLAVCHMTLSKYEEAARNFEAALEQNPNLGEAWHGLGVSRLNLDSPDRAKDALIKASQLMPTNPEVWMNLGVWHGTVGDHAGAQEMFEKARGYSPMNPVILGNLAMSHLNRGDAAQAERILAEAAQHNRDHFDTFVRLAEARTRGEKHTEAIEALERAIEINPANPAAWTNIAACYIRQGHARSAEVALQTALGLDPGNSEAAQMLAAIRGDGPARASKAA